MPASTMVSDCCKAVIVLDENDNYQCCACTRPCKSGGTLDDLARPNTRQRAERAAVTVAEMIERGMNFYIGGARRREIADIIAAEFDK